MNNKNVSTILNQSTFSKEDIVFLLDLSSDNDIDLLFKKAYEVKLQHLSNKAYFRGLIEFSNYCIKDCLYCGIRKSSEVKRFLMSINDISKMSTWAFNNNYGSVTLQSGERTDKDFIEFSNQAIKEIKKVSNDALGITLCLGEQSYDVYQKWFDLKAHRYLLRIETTNEQLYKSIHPNDSLHSLSNRIDCLKSLKKIGYQVGTGVMIGLPNQTTDMLADDILFFKKMDIDMIGMGPFILSKDTPLYDKAISLGLDSTEAKKYRTLLSLKMIAICRIVLKDVNIAATTALQALDPLGREKGLKAGANILMPIITLPKFRKDYQLYDDKPCLDDTADHCKVCLSSRVHSVGDVIGFNKWGDSPHFKKRNLL